jgi:hypothetical protein
MCASTHGKRLVPPIGNLLTTARQSLVCYVVAPRAAKPGIAPSGWRGLLAVRTGAIRQGSTLHRCKGRGAPGPAWALPYPGTY